VPNDSAFAEVKPDPRRGTSVALGGIQPPAQSRWSALGTSTLPVRFALIGTRQPRIGCLAPDPTICRLVATSLGDEPRLATIAALCQQAFAIRSP
jgi:hypothetical protein